MDKITYSEKLKSPRWQKKRLKILERDNWACTLCGDTETTLNVHHKKYTGSHPADTDESFLTTLCEICHDVVEYTKKANDTAVVVKIEKRKESHNVISYLASGTVDFFWVINDAKTKEITYLVGVTADGFNRIGKIANEIKNGN